MPTPVQLIVAAFDDEEEAGRLLDDLRLGRRVGLIGIIDAAAVTKDEQGRLRITNAKHRGRRGLLTGGAIGAVVGLLAGPVGWGAVAGGGAIGALTGKLRNTPMKAEMKDLAESLTPGSSALVALVEHTWVAKLEQMIAEDSARLVREELHADIAEQLAAGGNVLYSLTADSEHLGAVRAAGDAEHLEVSSLLASHEGIMVTEAQLTDEQLPELDIPVPEEADAPGGQ